MVTIAAILLLAVGMLGYALFFTRKGIRSEFVPGILVCSVICCMFVAGLLNCLVVATYAIVAAGAYLGFHTCRAISKEGAWRSVAAEWITPGNGIMLACLAAFAYLTYRQPLLHVDDFNHWGLITKQMFIENRLPNHASVMVFTTYPPGSALFVYFVTRFITYGEGQALFAQKILMVACAWPLLAFVPRRPQPKNGKGRWGALQSGLGLAATLPVIAMLLTSQVYTLSVDTLLTTVGIAGFAVAYFHRKDFVKAAWLSLPFAVAAALVKSSGMFFCGAQALLLIYCFFRYGRAEREGKRKKRCILALACSVGVPVAALLLWLAHVDMVFSDAHLSPHALSAAKYQLTFANKTAENIRSILELLLQRVFSVQNALFVHMLLWNAATLALALALAHRKQKSYRTLLRAVLFCDAVFVAYVAGTFGMYVFSMRQEEAWKLSGYSRYLFAGGAYCAAVFVIAWLSAIRALPGRRIGALCLSVLCAFVGQAVATGQMPVSSPLKRPAYEGTRIAEVDRAVLFETRAASTVVYCPETTDKDYFQTLLQYKLYAPMSGLTIIYEVDTDTENLWQTISRHDVLVVVDADARIEQIIKQHWWEREGTYVGTYLLEYAQ